MEKGGLEEHEEEMLFTSTRLMLAGLGLTALAIAGSVFVITDLLFHTLAGSVVATTAWYAWFWFGLPMSRRVEEGG